MRDAMAEMVYASDRIKDAPRIRHADGKVAERRTMGELENEVARRYDMARSWMIGDILDDVEAGHRAGCRSILLDVGNETMWRLSPLRTPDYRCNNLVEAARIITDDAAVALEMHYSNSVEQT